MTSYPTTEEITSQEGFDIETLIANLQSWERVPITLAELGQEVMTPALLHAWAYLAEAIFENNPTATLEGYKVVRPLTHDELTEKAITREKTRIYNARQEAEKEAAE